jgi:hypothetical protein
MASASAPGLLAEGPNGSHCAGKEAGHRWGCGTDAFRQGQCEHAQGYPRGCLRLRSGTCLWLFLTLERVVPSGYRKGA